MPLPPAANVVKVACQASLGDDLDVLNIFHVQFGADGPYDSTQLMAVAEMVFTNWSGNISSVQSNDLSWQAAEAHDLTTTTGGSVTFVPSSPVPGARDTRSLPANVALVASWREFISYRGGHPRSYVAGVPNDVLADPQHVNTTYAPQTQTACGSFLGAVNAASGGGLPASPKLVVVHYHSGHAVLTPPHVFDILGVAVNRRLDSQRRRLGA